MWYFSMQTEIGTCSHVEKDLFYYIFNPWQEYFENLMRMGYQH